MDNCAINSCFEGVSTIILQAQLIVLEAVNCAINCNLLILLGQIIVLGCLNCTITHQTVNCACPPLFRGGKNTINCGRRSA